MKVEITKLSFSYSSANVLDNISFCAHTGDCVAVLGINGVGKSTLLQCIDGLLKPSQGSVFFNGTDSRKIKRADLSKTVAFVRQQPTLADTTVFEAVLLGRKPHIRFETTAHDLSVTVAILERLGLSPLSQRSTAELSGGERQKTAIARALAQEAKLLLLDEPTSDLDLKNQVETAALLRDIAKSDGVTVIATLHDINLALRFADRFLLLKENRVFAFGGKEILTAETLSHVYGTPVSVGDIDGRMTVTST